MSLKGGCWTARDASESIGIALVFRVEHRGSDTVDLALRCIGQFRDDFGRGLNENIEELCSSSRGPNDCFANAGVVVCCAERHAARRDELTSRRRITRSIEIDAE